jgi:hypothetical protein
MISAVFSLPRFVERAKAVTVTLALTEGEYGVAVASGTYTLLDGDRTSIQTGAVTVTAVQGVVSFAVLAASVTVDPADDWQEEWAITTSAGEVHTFRRDVFVCRRLLYPVVSEAMLVKRVSDLLTICPDPTPHLEEAWDDVQTRLIESGRLPYLTFNAWALKRLLLATTLAYVYRNASTFFENSGRYAMEAEAYRKEADAAFSELRLEVDTTENMEREDAATDHAGAPFAGTPLAGIDWGRNGF